MFLGMQQNSAVSMKYVTFMYLRPRVDRGIIDRARIEYSKCSYQVFAAFKSTCDEWSCVLKALVNLFHLAYVSVVLLRISLIRLPLLVT